jgi:hypothetical protein
MTTGAGLDQVVGQLGGRAGAVAICLDVDGGLSPRSGMTRRRPVRYPGGWGCSGRWPTGTPR